LGFLGGFRGGAFSEANWVMATDEEWMLSTVGPGNVIAGGIRIIGIL
jgi:hypothetical protein